MILWILEQLLWQPTNFEFRYIADKQHGAEVPLCAQVSLKINSTATYPKFLNLRMPSDRRLVNQELQSQMVRLLNIDYFLLQVGDTSPMMPIFPRQWKDYHNGGVVHEPNNLWRGESSHLLHPARSFRTVQRLWQSEKQLWKGNDTLLIQVLFLTCPPPPLRKKRQR